MVRRYVETVVLLAAVCAAGTGCGLLPGALTAPLGGSVAGQRGIIQVVFINNTPHRVVFSAGTFDPQDQFTVPDFLQFGLDNTGLDLEGNATSDILSLTCGRTFSVGGPTLIDLITAIAPVRVDQSALVTGVEFREAPAGDAPDDPPRVVGRAPAFEARLGLDFPCGALLIVRFEFDDLGPDPFRIDFQLIPSESTR